MAIDGVSGRTSYIGSSILNLRNQLNDLTTQLASGKMSTTYAGQGADRGFALSLRAQVSSIDAFADTATNVNTRHQRRQSGAAGIVRHRHDGEERGRHRRPSCSTTTARPPARSRRRQRSPMRCRCSTASPATVICFPAAPPTRRRPCRPTSCSTARHAGRLEAADQRAPAGRSGRRQHGTPDGVVAAADDDRDQRCRRRLVVRLQARRRSPRR